MNLQKLEKLSPYCWQVLREQGYPGGAARLYGSESLIAAMDEKVYEQITNVARLPGLVGAAMTMPDAHWGYGFPIGGVAAFDAEAGGIISAGGVGFDISCGIRTLRSNLTFNEIKPQLAKLADILYRHIPAGVGTEGRIRLSGNELDAAMTGGAKWAVANGFGNQHDLDFIEEHGKVSGADPKCVSELAKKRQLGEMGTLGSGNHYLEIQVVDRIYDQQAADAFGVEIGQILVSIHCGSRGFGHQIGTDYLLSLYKGASRLGIDLPDRELACAPILSPEGKAYLGAMNSAINIALANRQILAHLTREAFAKIIPHARLETLYDVSHNTCKLEMHQVEGRDRMLYVHRKGATRAFGPDHPSLPGRYRIAGQPVIIGGSMGTGSYILAGNMNNPAFASASHGAGRAMSRSQALKKWQGRQLIDELAQKGILIRAGSMRGAAEEAPGAYKDVDIVALDTENANLARRVAYLKPKACIKG